jgi:hypothetical protein
VTGDRPDQSAGEAGDQAGEPDFDRRTLDNLGDERVARLGALTATGPVALLTWSKSISVTRSSSR